VLGVLLLYSYARFFVVPYLGFQFNSTAGEVVEIYVLQDSPPFLELGDKLLQVNDHTWQDHLEHLDLDLFAGAKTGETLFLRLEEINGTKTLYWNIPGFTSSEFLSRLVNTWWLSYFFWLAGTATILLVRPRNQRRTLLALFSFVTAIWFMAGTLSIRVVWGSPYLLRAAIWMSLPIYLHLHWNFPRQLGRLPKQFWRLLYSASAVFALAQILEIIGRDSYLIPFAVAILGSVLLLLLRLVLRPAERREIGLLFFAATLALAPALVLAILNVQGNVPIATPGYILSMIALPGAYFYVVYRRQLGGLELRANRLISLYLFVVLMVTLALALLPMVSAEMQTPQAIGGAILITALIATLLSIFGFPNFQRFVERRLLFIPQPPQHLLETFASRISTSISYEHLSLLLQNEVLPSLLIRQSVLFSLQGVSLDSRPVYIQGLESNELPNSKQQKLLLSMHTKFGPAEKEQTHLVQLSWIRFALPLRVGGEVIGLWLLGRKDPDDYYSQSERILLASLADQTAIALANISQAQRLRALHQFDIDRQEQERVQLARELHDGVLQDLNRLLSEVGEHTEVKDFDKQHQQVDDLVRGIIDSLRPPLLDQDLYLALQQLAEDLAEKRQAQIRFEIKAPKTLARFDPLVQQHLYRIVQQACENAIQHGQAKCITITGSISAAGLQLLVQDDGQGFQFKGSPELAELLAARHFGLAGMVERAALIDAALQIESTPRRGTRIRLNWKPEKHE